MLTAKCKRCGERYFGWALSIPENQKCPQCGSNLVIKLGRFGKFYACPAFPECKYTEPIVNSTGVKCPKCHEGEIVERKTKKAKEIGTIG